MFQKDKSNYASDKIGTIIGEQAEFEGILRFTEAARINGNIKGEIISKSNVIIGETGRINGNITAENLLVAGLVEGDIKSEKIEITATGSVYGNIVTNKIVIDENAVFGGKCEMNRTSKEEPEVLVEAE